MKFILYGLFLLSFVFFSFLFIDQNFFYLKDFYSGFAFLNRNITTILYIVFVLFFFTTYTYILKYVSLFDVAKTKLLVGITMILVLAYPAMLSYDIFNYATTAKVTFQYLENPYIVMPIEFTGDPLLLFTHAANKIALYGPIWLGLSAIPFLLGLGNYLLTLFSFKVFISLFYIGTVYVIWRMTKNLLSVSLFALNPLVLIETLMSSHNDIVMMFFALVSFFLLSRKKLILAVLVFSLSIFIKYATVFLLPVFIYAEVKIIRKENLNWQKIYLIAFLSMFIIFISSHFREEIYPWYAIWFLPFAALITKRKIILYISLAFSFGLLFRYVPFMLYGTHFGMTPIIKNFVTFIPAFLVLFYYFFKNKLWLKISP